MKNKILEVIKICKYLYTKEADRIYLFTNVITPEDDPINGVYVSLTNAEGLGGWNDPKLLKYRVKKDPTIEVISSKSKQVVVIQITLNLC